MFDFLQNIWSRTLSLFSSPQEVNVLQIPLNVARQNPYASLATGTCIIGAGLLYRYRHGLKSYFSASKTDLLNQAIMQKNEDVASKLIAEMTVDELNQADSNKRTPLYLALNHSRKLTTQIVNKFLSEKCALNTAKPDGKSLFTSDNLSNKILSVVCGQYKDYHCGDAKRFPGNINPKADKEQILARKPKAAFERQAAEASTIQAYNGHYSRKAIERCAELVDKSKSGACTSFALAMADKLLDLFPNERIEIMGHVGGYRGTHVYVVMNHKGDDWKLNDIENQLADKNLSKEQKSHLIDDVAEQLSGTFVIDPWLASLGWSNGVFTPMQYFEMKVNSHFLFGVETLFDSSKSTSPRLQLN
jgi:hypothetical protein